MDNEQVELSHTDTVKHTTTEGDLAQEDKDIQAAAVANNPAPHAVIDPPVIGVDEKQTLHPGTESEEVVEEEKEPVTLPSDSNLSPIFDLAGEKTGKKVNVMAFDKETGKADVIIEGYTARQTEQVLTSDARVTSLGRDDHRELLRVGTGDIGSIRDRYCFDINGNRVSYFD